jgi:small subunit ribosomal protein S1
MSTPEMPPQSPLTPVASDDGSHAPSEPHAGASEAVGNGKPGDAAATSVDAVAHEDVSRTEEGEHDHAAPGTEQEADSAAPAGIAEKKRRRRRRKKKPGAQATGEAGAPSDSPDATDGPPADGAAEPVTEGPRVERPVDRRDRKKEKRHTGPPRERPPVNMGDIVFGKILEITDEAIFVDIPGKAHAIFDRREMLLPDDEDEGARPARSSATPEHSLDEPAAASEAAPADAEVPAPSEDRRDGTSAAPPRRGPHMDGTSADPPRRGLQMDDASAPAEAAPVEAAAEGPLPEAVEAPPPAVEPIAEEVAPAPGPPKEPKVPRVILEVGADFIAVVHNDGARGGLVVLTHHPKRVEKVKAALEKACQEKTTTLGLVTGVIKGGIEVDVDGLRAFAPGSHVDLRMGADLSPLVGKRLPFFVTQYAKRGRDVVLSRKSIIEEESRKARAEALAKLKVGEELDGVVRSVVPFGAFVDVGGIEGLVPLQEMSHNRADGPSDIFKAGEPTRVKVIKIDDRGKVWLSRKATIADPWQKVAQKYALGTRHTGKVVRLQPFGAFIELESGVDGLIHTQDLSIKRIESPSDVVKVGDSIEVVVAHVDPTQHKIALHPALPGDLANEAPQRVAPHKPLKAKIVGIESGGLVVRILGVTGRNARGYITSAATGTPRGTELRKAFSVGQEVEAKVVEVDPRRGEVKLSIKALSEEQERSAYQQYRQQLKAEARFTLADLITKKGR